MGSEWTETTLGELCENQGGSIQTGPFGSQLHASDYQDAGTPVVMPVNLVCGRVSEAGIARVGEAHVSSLARHKLLPGDIVFSRRGDVTRFALITERESGWLCGTGCLKVSLGEQELATAEFVAGVLSLPESKEWLVQHAVGATMPNLNTSILSALPVRLPDLATQRSATSLLMALTARMESLRQTNGTLEAIAQALFKSWFVDFDPVRAKTEGREPEGMDAATASLFPADFGDSRMGSIPLGWQPIRYGDVAFLSKGTAKPQAMPCTEFQHYSLPAFDAHGLPVAELGEAIKSNKTPVPSGAVLVSKLNPHIPRIWYVGDVAENSVCSTEFLVWTPKAGVGSALVYCLAASQVFNSAMRQLVTGTSNSHQRVKPDQLADVEVIAASDDTISAFDSIVTPLLVQVHHNRQLAATLALLRDTLLPRLISGKLRLPDAETQIEALA